MKEEVIPIIYLYFLSVHIGCEQTLGRNFVICGHPELSLLQYMKKALILITIKSSLIKNENTVQYQ